MVETRLDYMLRTKKQVRATIKKEGGHYVVSVGGHGMTLADTKAQAKKIQKQYRKQIESARKKMRK